MLTVGFFYLNQLSNIQVAYQKHLEWRSSTQNIKALIIVAVACFYMNQITNIHLTYLRHVESRLSMLPKKIIKRNGPEPRTFMYYERTVLRLSATTFRSHFRLTKTTFVNLCNLLGPIMAPNVDASSIGRPNTPIEKQILPVLWLLATPDSYRFVYILKNLPSECI